MSCRILLLSCLITFGCAAEALWIEGEAPTTRPDAILAMPEFPDAGLTTAGWGDTGVMSAGAVLAVNLDPAAVERFVGDEGLVFTYAFTVPTAGRRQVWARIGYEWARAAFEWRLGDGDWQRVGSDVPTTDLQPIQTWNELAWLRLDERDFSAGEHRFSIRWPKVVVTEKDKAKTQRILGLLDCLCIAADFRPNGKWAPGADWRGEDETAAAATVYALPEPAMERTSVDLSGWWECAAWEESLPLDEANRLEAVRELPALDRLAWYAYRVPGDRNAQHPQWAFAHRWIARARVAVPAAADGRSFHLDIQRFSAVASVFVNGTFCDWSRNHSTGWRCDVSAAVRPGEINEIAIVFKDRYYSLAGSDQAHGNRQFWNLPNDFLSTNQGTGARHELAIAADPTTGLTEPVALVVGGTVYAEDVFCQPSVRDQALTLTVTVRNPTDRERTVTVGAEVQPWQRDAATDGPVELTIPGRTVTVAARSQMDVELNAPFPQARLWWPDDPHLYWAVTRVADDDGVADVARTRFGFREWDWATDHQFRLNGVRWQLWADLGYGRSPETLLERLRVSGMNQIRLWSNGGWWGKSRRDTLAWMDENGVIVRSSGTFDGQVANYGGGLREQGPDGKPRAKAILFRNWQEQLLAWVRSERNHPSVYIWSLENEIAYINSWNLGQAKQVEPALRDAGRAVMALDPTRPVMVDGGNALQDESLPINGAHYTELYNASWGDFPDAAYTRDHWYDAERPQRGAWRMVPNRPIMKGEVYFAEGYGNDAFATVGGDRCFIGIGETFAARGLWGRMLSEGWRWAEVSSWHFWLGSIGGHDRQYWNAWQPIAVLCRQWNWSFGSGQPAERLLKVFNQTRFAEPITVRWAVTVAGAAVADGERTFALAPGTAEEWAIDFTVPLATGLRTPGTFVLTATRGGAEVFRDERPLAVIDHQSVAKPDLPGDAIACIDPSGLLVAHLQRRGIAHTAIALGDPIPDRAKLVLVGPDALSAEQAADTTWHALAASGRRVVVFDQAHPLRYGGLPADAEPTTATGCIAFAEDLTHPIVAGLDQADFFTWGNDHLVYRNAWAKPTRGGRSLMQCDRALSRTALLECVVGDGLLIASQLALGARLADEGMCQLLTDRIIAYAATWQPVRRSVTSTLATAAPESALLEAIGATVTRSDDPLAALDGGGIAIIAATPTNLQLLAEARDRVQAFCEQGGWLMLWGLTPEGLAAYNRLVGHEHVIRPFETERVLLSVPADPLTAGLTSRDVVMDTGAKMYPWMALRKPDSDAFSYVIDHLDIAPFSRFPSPREMGKGTDTPGVDHWPRNLVNGFTSEDNWAFTYTTILDQGHSPVLTLELPKEEELVALKVRTSSIYHPVTRIDVTFDDDPTPVQAELRPEPLVQEIPVAGRRARRITLTIAGWQERGERNIVVLDNLWLQVRRDETYLRTVKSMLNVGALMRYDIGTGGILLNQIKVLPSEANPINQEKKRSIVKALLANLGASFGGGRTVVAGAHLRYAPLRIPDGAFTAYVHRRGQPAWFPGGGDLAGLPVGEQRFANISWFVSDFSTSPVPAVLMPSGPGSEVKAATVGPIAVDQRADALYVLHTAHPGPAIAGWQRAYTDAVNRRRELPEPPVVGRYRIRYDDGSEVIADLRWSIDVGGWRTAAPQALPGAALAWAGEAVDGHRPALYAWQWANPHPERAIASVEVLAAPDAKAGTIACFAITVANAQ